MQANDTATDLLGVMEEIRTENPNIPDHRLIQEARLILEMRLARLEDPKKGRQAADKAFREISAQLSWFGRLILRLRFAITWFFMK